MGQRLARVRRHGILLSLGLLLVSLRATAATEPIDLQHVAAHPTQYRVEPSGEAEGGKIRVFLKDGGTSHVFDHQEVAPHRDALAQTHPTAFRSSGSTGGRASQPRARR